MNDGVSQPKSLKISLFRGKTQVFGNRGNIGFKTFVISKLISPKALSTFQVYLGDKSSN